MTYVRRGVFVLLVAMMAAVALAQGRAGDAPGRGQGAPLDGGAANLQQDPNVDYGDGGGGTDPFCYFCQTIPSNPFYVRCREGLVSYGGAIQSGYKKCVALNSNLGPNGCVLSGAVCYWNNSARSPLDNTEDAYTLAVVLGDAAMASFMDAVAMRTLGMTPDARIAEEARLYSEKLSEVSLDRYGINPDERLVIPRHRQVQP